MKNIIKFTGIIICISAILSVFIIFAEALDIRGWYLLLALFSIFLSFSLGAAIYAVGDLLNRVSYLERKLKMHVKDEPDYNKVEKKEKRKIKGSDYEMTQKRCPDCGDTHDFDFQKCPHCGYIYELKIEE